MMPECPQPVRTTRPVRAPSPRGLHWRRGSDWRILPAELSAVVVTAAREGFVSGLNQILVVGAVIAMIGALLSVWLVRPGDIRVDDDLT